MCDAADIVTTPPAGVGPRRRGSLAARRQAPRGAADRTGPVVQVARSGAPPSGSRRPRPRTAARTVAPDPWAPRQRAGCSRRLIVSGGGLAVAPRVDGEAGVSQGAPRERVL